MSKPSLQTQQDHMDIGAPVRSLQIRQDRIPLRVGEAEAQIQNNKYPVLDISSFGLSLASPGKWSHELSVTCQLYAGATCLGDFSLNFIREEKHLEGFKVAFEVDSSSPVISLDALYGARDLNLHLEEHSHFFMRDDISPEFKSLTYQVHYWLTSLETRVNSLEINSFQKSRAEIDAYESVITQMVAKYIEQSIYPIYQKLEEISKSLSPKALKSHFEYFRSVVGRQMFQSYYANRAYQKPRGYAGDFEMMRTVYNKEVRGAQLFGRCIERYFTDVPEAQAVRNRGRYLTSKIEKAIEKNRKAKIVSVASGPAMEVQYLVNERPDLLGEVEIHLIDQDTDALKLSQRAIEEICRAKGLRPNIKFHNMAIKNIIESGLPIKDVDLIYTAGLFDYLSGPVATAAARSLFQSLSDKGALIIGNFDTSAPNRFGMALVTDWHLIYRTEEELVELFKPVSRVSIEKEPLGINLFAVLCR